MPVKPCSAHTIQLSAKRDQGPPEETVTKPAEEPGRCSCCQQQPKGGVAPRLQGKILVKARTASPDKKERPHCQVFTEKRNQKKKKELNDT